MKNTELREPVKTPEEIASLFGAEFSPLNDLPIEQARKRIACMIREYVIAYLRTKEAQYTDCIRELEDENLKNHRPRSRYNDIKFPFQALPKQRD